MTSLLWKELHTHALEYEPTTKGDRNWIQQWSKKIPRFTTGCRCKEHWNIWLKRNPPVFTTTEAYFEWTVKAHNAVNERLGKPVLTVEEAKQMYSDN